MIGKKDKLTPKTVIHPTSALSAKWLFSIAKAHPFIEHGTLISLKDPDTNQPVDVVFTYPMFSFEKPKRQSERTGIWKNAGNYYAVFKSAKLGSGQFGSVYPVIGVWKYTDTKWIFKTKASPDKEYVVKSNVFEFSAQPHEIRQSYIKEQQIGKWVKHMGYNYPVAEHNPYFFLLMRRQVGSTLKSIIIRLKLDPNSLSMTQKFQVTINLLEGLETQISSIKIPQNENDDESYLVHQDIKPENIMLGPDFNTRYIDFGLSIPNTIIINNVIYGTPIYIDPGLSDGSRLADKASDLWSLFRVIGEFFGDNSADPLQNQAELYQRNRDNRLTGVLKGVTGLTDHEKTTIPLVLKKGVSYDLLDRWSREEAKSEFEKLLQMRLEEEKNHLTILVEYSRIEELTVNELLFILNSSRAFDFIKKFERLPQRFVPCIDKLSLQQLLGLDVPVLQEMRRRYTNFTLPALKPTLQEKKINIAKITTLIQLYTPVEKEVLNFWMNLDCLESEELRWANICRLLYNACGKPDHLLAEWKETDTFKSVYFHHFLGNKEVPSDDKENIEIITKHLEITRQLKHTIYWIKTGVERHFNNTPFGLTLVSRLEEYERTQSLFLLEGTLINRISTVFNSFHDVLQNISSVVVIDEMKNRTALIKSIDTQLDAIKQSNDGDWEAALTQLENIIKTSNILCELEFLIKRLRNDIPPTALNDILKVTDEFYKFEKSMREISYVTRAMVFNALQSINAINIIRKEMVTLDVSFASDSFIEKEFHDLVLSASYKSAKEFRDTLSDFQNVYSKTIKLFKQIKNGSQGEVFENDREQLITDIRASLVNILGDKDKVDSIEEHIRENIQTISAKTSLRKSGSNIYFFNEINELQEEIHQQLGFHQ